LERLLGRCIVGLALVVLPCVTGTLALAFAQQRVGVGDSRLGYERSDFRTDSQQLPTTGNDEQAVRWVEPMLGLPSLLEARPSIETISLGRKLFFDRRLSFNGVLSCAMCHVPEQGFAQNELATPVGTEGSALKRNAPSLYNVGFRTRLFHDGREHTLENQVWSPLLAANEMANPSVGSVLSRIEGLTDYAGLFEAAFGRGPSMETLGAALASYERTLASADSDFDRYYFDAQPQALSAPAVAGFEVFQRLGCNGCHLVAQRHAHFTDERFHDTGIGYRNAQTRSVRRTVALAPGVEIVVDAPPPAADLGRYEATGRTEDRWKYRTPTLRNVELTAPYMHDGSLRTLEDVIDHYAEGGTPHPGQDPRIKAFELSGAEREYLVEFLRSLTGANVDQLAVVARSEAIGDY
jgi:cytochrome c peroxidase